MNVPEDPARQLLPTAHGPGAVRVFPAGRAARPSATSRGTLLVGHGAGGRRDAADVLALTALVHDGWSVVLVDQPWRVAGRTVATPPPTLDRGWLDLLAALARDGRAPDGAALPRPWVYAGRSAGARVACRTAVPGPGVQPDQAEAEPGAPGGPGPPPVAVLALAFPLHPPGRPERSRAPELRAPLRAGVPTLVVQGRRDPMGTPEQVREAVADAAAGVLTLREVPGTHSPTRDLDLLLRHVRDFLDAVVSAGGVASVGPDPTRGAPRP